MSNFKKKLVVNLSESLCQDFDKALKKDRKKRSEFIREAIILYIEKKKKLSFMEQMKNGYIDMGEINQCICECGIDNDFNDLLNYEVKLSERDMSNDNDSEKRRYILC